MWQKGREFKDHFALCGLIFYVFYVAFVCVWGCPEIYFNVSMEKQSNCFRMVLNKFTHHGDFQEYRMIHASYINNLNLASPPTSLHPFIIAINCCTSTCWLFLFMVVKKRDRRSITLLLFFYWFLQIWNFKRLIA